MCDVSPSFIRWSLPTARLVHKCDECGLRIMPEEEYVAATGCWDGEVSTYKAHVLCDMLASQINRDDDGCRPLGALREVAGDVNLSPLHARWFQALTGWDP